MASFVHRLASGDTSMFKDLQCDGPWEIKMKELINICKSMPTMHPSDLLPRILKDCGDFLFLYKPPYWICMVNEKDPSYDIDNPRMYAKLLIPRFASVNLGLDPEVNNTRNQYGLCNRLDDQTSGIVIIARKLSTYRQIRNLINAHETTCKVYFALVHGSLGPKRPAKDVVIQRIEDDICCETKDQTNMMTCTTSPASSVKNKKDNTCRAARTEYIVLKNYTTCTLVAVRIYTGITHQIRVHFKSIGHPLVGDDKYSTNVTVNAGNAGNAVVSSPRLFLHSTMYGIKLKGRAPERAVSTLPPDLLHVLHGLDGNRKKKCYLDPDWVLEKISPLLI